MATLGTIIADFTTSLASAIAVGGTTGTLQSATDDDGVALPSGRYFFTIDGANANKEHISCQLSGTSLTSIKSVSRQGVETTGTARAHRLGATVTITDYLSIKLLNDMISGAADLDADVPLKYDATATITDNNALATKAYVDGVAIAGAPDAATGTKGITKLSVAPASAANPIAVGDNDTRVPTAGQASLLSTLYNALPGMIFMYGATSAPTGFLLCDGSAVSRATYSTLFGVVGTSYGTGDGSSTFNVPNLKSAFPLGYGQRTETFTFDGASAVDPSTNEITVSSNDWLHTGQAVALTGSSLPAGLSATTYYVIRVSATVIKLATSVANANAGTAVDITADGSGTCTLTLTLTSRSLGAEGGEETHALTDAEMPSHVHSAVTSAAGTNSNLDATYPASDGTTRDTGSAGSDTVHNNMPPYVVVNYLIKT